MDKNILQDKCRGSLIGGAIGDALGYAVEFMNLEEINRRFGDEGIKDFALDSEGIARFSDDTQMTLFTAYGLLYALANGKSRKEEIVHSLRMAYGLWYDTQVRRPLGVSSNWLLNIPELWVQRAPGNTCMSALAVVSKTGYVPVMNQSKGCGGVMRVAPIGIYSGANPKSLYLEEAGYLAGQAAEITHKHPLSTCASMALAMIVADCIGHDKIDREMFRFIVFDRVFKLLEMHIGKNAYLSELRAFLEKGVQLAVSSVSDRDAISELGEGWVAEETLAIAVFSVMRYIDDFEKCLRCAVNHDGDSDSTGAVAGNIIGAILGFTAIPIKYITSLELHDVILSMADDLAGASGEDQRVKRYIKPNFLVE